MRYIINQILRGMVTLPHVGSNPGNEELFDVVITCMCLLPIFGTIMFMSTLFLILMLLPFYLVGCYNRACLSDALDNREQTSS